MDNQKNEMASPRRRRRPSAQPEGFEEVEKVQPTAPRVPEMAVPSYHDEPEHRHADGEIKAPVRKAKNTKPGRKKKKKNGKRKQYGAAASRQQGCGTEGQERKAGSGLSSKLLSTVRIWFFNLYACCDKIVTILRGWRGPGL